MKVSNDNLLVELPSSLSLSFQPQNSLYGKAENEKIKSIHSIVKQERNDRLILNTGEGIVTPSPPNDRQVIESGPHNYRFLLLAVCKMAKGSKNHWEINIF